MNVEKITIVDSQDEVPLYDASFANFDEARAYILEHEQELRDKCLTNAIAIIRKAGYADTEEAARKMAVCNSSMVGEPRVLIDNLTTGNSRMVDVLKNNKEGKHKLTMAELSEVRRKACLKGLKIRQANARKRGSPTTIGVVDKDANALREYARSNGMTLVDAFHDLLVKNGIRKVE